MDTGSDITASMMRINQLQAMLAAVSAPPPQPTSAQPPTGFASQLSQASAELATPTAGGPVTAAGPLGQAAAPSSSAGGGDVPFAAEIDASAQRNGIDPALLRGLIRQESNFNPKAGSPAGAQGLTQLMPGTARSVGVTNPNDPVQSIEGGAKYLKQQLDRFSGDVTLALAAYNAGPGAVQRYNGVPPYAETREYVRRVQAYAAEYRGGGGSTSSYPGS